MFGMISELSILLFGKHPCLRNYEIIMRHSVLKPLSLMVSINHIISRVASLFWLVMYKIGTTWKIAMLYA